MEASLAPLLSQPWPRIWMDEVDSTNREAERRAGAGDFGPAWISARTQTAGQGRRGRNWMSDAGNLFTSALFPFSGDLQSASLICFSTCIALRTAIADIGVDVSDVSYKWPNDLRWRGRKLSGILIETSSTRQAALYPMIVGIGVNILTAPETDQPTACLMDLPVNSNANVDPDTLLERLAYRFQEVLLEQVSTGFEPVRSAWLQQAEGLGEAVHAKIGAQSVTGVFQTIDLEGAMVILTEDGQQRRITAGDVNLVRNSQ